MMCRMHFIASTPGEGCVQMIPPERDSGELRKAIPYEIGCDGLHFD
jgi:hypothetical protein